MMGDREGALQTPVHHPTSSSRPPLPGAPGLTNLDQIFQGSGCSP